MAAHTDHTTLLNAVYALGERLRAVLEAGDVDIFADLVDARGALLEGLDASSLAAPDEWRQLAALLHEQQAALMIAAAAHEQRLQAAQRTLKQLKQASTQYRKRRERPRILHEHLRG